MLDDEQNVVWRDWPMLLPHKLELRLQLGGADMFIYSSDVHKARLLQWPVVVILICWWLTGIWFPATGNVFFASTPATLRAIK